ncbi:MAG: hypothetical protein ACJ8AS_03155 [Hyphomicrobiales bacterium]
MATDRNRKSEKPEEKRKIEEDRKERPVPITEPTDRGVENADNSDYTDGTNIGP